VYALNAHASFSCRHSGACCTAGWAIPVEPDKRARIPVAWLTPDTSGACPEFDRATHLCRIHRDHGEPMLPESCRHFPRRALLDDRGTFITLSHFCPTASRLLVESTAPLAVVGLAGREPSRVYEGLDARGEWPPLLRPGVLFDYESFDVWIRFAVQTLGNATAPATALGQVGVVADRVRNWRVEDGPLLDWTRAAVERTVSARELTVAFAHHDERSRTERYERVRQSVLAGMRVPTIPDDLEIVHRRWLAEAWESDARPAGRYLAARVFAAWTPYQSRDIRVHIAELRIAEAVIYIEAARVCAARQAPLDVEGWIAAIRASDWLLMHVVDRDALLAWLNGTTA
jgi:hypothetical protein